MTAPGHPPAHRWSAGRWLLLIAGFTFALPALLFVVATLMVGWSMRGAAGRAKALCAAYPVGAVTDVDAIRRRATAEGFRVDVLPIEGGSRLEARTGVMTTIYTCAIEVRAGRVASTHNATER